MADPIPTAIPAGPVPLIIPMLVALEIAHDVQPDAVFPESVEHGDSQGFRVSPPLPGFQFQVLQTMSMADVLPDAAAPPPT